MGSRICVDLVQVLGGLNSGSLRSGGQGRTLSPDSTLILVLHFCCQVEADTVRAANLGEERRK